MKLPASKISDPANSPADNLCLGVLTKDMRIQGAKVAARICMDQNNAGQDWDFNKEEVVDTTTTAPR